MFVAHAGLKKALVVKQAATDRYKAGAEARRCAISKTQTRTTCSISGSASRVRMVEIPQRVDHGVLLLRRRGEVFIQ